MGPYLGFMKSYRSSPAQDGVDSLLMTAAFIHRGTPYRAAVAQHSALHKPEYRHMYHVLLQSNDAFQAFIMWQGDEGLWECDSEDVLREIVFRLGSEITKG